MPKSTSDSPKDALGKIYDVIRAANEQQTTDPIQHLNKVWVEVFNAEGK